MSIAYFHQVISQQQNNLDFIGLILVHRSRCYIDILKKLTVTLTSDKLLTDFCPFCTDLLFYLIMVVRNVLLHVVFLRLYGTPPNS